MHWLVEWSSVSIGSGGDAVGICEGDTIGQDCRSPLWYRFWWRVMSFGLGGGVEGGNAPVPRSHILSTRGTECVTLTTVQVLTSEDREATILSTDGIGAYDLISREHHVSRGGRHEGSCTRWSRSYGSSLGRYWHFLVGRFGKVYHVRQGVKQRATRSVHSCCLSPILSTGLWSLSS